MIKISLRPDGSVDDIMRMTHRIWLAGLGAFAATEEKGKELFKTLVEEGKRVESHTRQAAGRQVEAVLNTVEHAVEDIKDRAVDVWEDTEQRLEDRISRVFIRFGVLTHEDIQELLERIENLNDNVRLLLEKESR